MIIWVFVLLFVLCIWVDVAYGDVVGFIYLIVLLYYIVYRCVVLFILLCVDVCLWVYC